MDVEWMDTLASDAQAGADENLVELLKRNENDLAPEIEARSQAVASSAWMTLLAVGAGAWFLMSRRKK